MCEARLPQKCGNIAQNPPVAVIADRLKIKIVLSSGLRFYMQQKQISLRYESVLFSRIFLQFSGT